MAVQKLPPRRRIESWRDIAAWVNEYVAQGQQPMEAAQQAFDEMLRTKRGADVLEALGSRYAFYTVWRDSVRGDRYHHPDEDDAASGPATPMSERPTGGTPNPRRIPAAVVNGRDSLYAKLINVGRDNWVPLGDLRKGHCLRLATAYRSRGESMLTIAQAWDALSGGLEDDTTTIRQRFSEAELANIWPGKAA
jgi:hypothetical protein